MRIVAFEDVDESAVLEDDDVPGFVEVFVRSVDRAERHVGGDEVLQIAIGVLPGRKPRQALAVTIDELDLAIAKLDGEVVDGANVVEIGHGPDSTAAKSP